MDDLTNSSHLLVDTTAVFDTITDSDSVVFSLNTEINSLEYFLARSARRRSHGSNLQQMLMVIETANKRTRYNYDVAFN
jgi:hypothetical protein